MPKRSGRAKVIRLPKRRERDVNELASAVIRRTLELADDAPAKDPAAVALGRRGGLKGGRARMAAMTAEERRALASKAARARWKSKTHH
jgi:hypothetical protein